jgi:hypothetical protein
MTLMEKGLAQALGILVADAGALARFAGFIFLAAQQETKRKFGSAIFNPIDCMEIVFGAQHILHPGCPAAERRGNKDGRKRGAPALRRLQHVPEGMS